MADVTGPVSTLPGHQVRLKTNTIMCDEHPTRVAIERIQGETDSFGAEYWHACAACVKRHEVEMLRERNEKRHCDWCKRAAVNCRPMRDVDEGSTGPVYQVCPACREAERQRLEDEWAQE